MELVSCLIQYIPTETRPPFFMNVSITWKSWISIPVNPLEANLLRRQQLGQEKKRNPDYGITESGNGLIMASISRQDIPVRARAGGKLTTRPTGATNKPRLLWDFKEKYDWTMWGSVASEDVGRQLDDSLAGSAEIQILGGDHSSSLSF
jgi:hypothetical protein